MLPTRVFLLAIAVVLDAVSASVLQVQVTNDHPDGLVFLPNTTVAFIDDVVSFVFTDAHGGTVNHSVVQTSYEHPCTPLDGGFSSPTDGMPSGASFNVRMLTRSVTVWYTCGHPGHCQAGHVGAINAPLAGLRTLATFRAAAEGLAADDGAAFARLPANGTRAGALTRDAGVIGYLPPGAPLALPLSTMSFTGTADAPSASQSGVGHGTGDAGDTGGGGVWSDEGRGPHEGTHYGARLSEGLIALIVGLSVGIPGALALIALAVWRWKLIARRRARTVALAQKLARAGESKAVNGADVSEKPAA